MEILFAFLAKGEQNYAFLTIYANENEAYSSSIGFAGYTLYNLFVFCFLKTKNIVRLFSEQC